MVTSVETGVPFNTLTNPFPNGILTPSGTRKGWQLLSDSPLTSKSEPRTALYKPVFAGGSAGTAVPAPDDRRIRGQSS